MKSVPMCFVCDEEFKYEKQLENHLMFAHNKWNIVQKLKKYRNNYN